MSQAGSLSRGGGGVYQADHVTVPTRKLQTDLFITPHLGFGEVSVLVRLSWSDSALGLWFLCAVEPTSETL